MTEDEQEALSRKYSDNVVILLPLSSGNIAWFDNARKLWMVTSDIALTCGPDITLSARLKDISSRCAKAPPSVRRAIETLKETVVNLEELDL